MRDSPGSAALADATVSTGRATVLEAAPALDAIVLAACVVGLVLRFVHLGSAPLWFDETYTVRHMRTPWGDLPQQLLADNQAPLYYVMLKAWTTFAGLSAWALRAPGAIESALFVPLAAATAQLLGGRRVARAAAWLAAVSPYLIQHGQEARPYALLATLGAAHIYLLARFTEGRSRRIGAVWVLGAMAIVLTHYYGIFLLAGEGIALLVLRPQPLRSWLPAGLVAGLLCVSIVAAAALMTPGSFAGEYRFGPTALPGVVWSLVTGYALLPSSEALHANGVRAVVPYLPVALLTLPAFAIVAIAGFRALDRRARILLGVTFGIALLTPFAVRVVAGAGVHPRYFAATLMPILLTLAAGMARPGWNVRGAASFVLLAVMALASAYHLHDTTHGREDVASAGRWLDANVPPDEEILVTSDEMETLARFHWPNRRFRLYPNRGDEIPSDAVNGIADALPFPGHARAIFIFGRAWLTDPNGALQTALSRRYSACAGTEVAGIRILCLRAPDGGAVARSH